MSDAAERYIEALRAGDGFSSPANDLIVGNGIDPEALLRFRHELQVADGPTREAIVELLVDVGIQSDPLVEQGVSVLRQPDLIDALIVEGCAKADQGCLSALDGVRVHAPSNLLTAYRPRIAEIFARQHSEAALLAVAKSKAHQALDSLKRSEPNGSSLIALAAMGDEAAELKLLDAMREASKGEELAVALADASLAGSAKLLHAIAGNIRTSYQIDIPGVHIISVRLHVLDALRYNFPEIPQFYSENIISDDDYIAAETLISEMFKLNLTAPRPEFLTLLGYPRL